MGCCWSDPLSVEAVLLRRQGPAAVKDNCYPDKLGPGGVKILTSSSATDGSNRSGGRSYSRLVVGSDWILAALFEAHGPGGTDSSNPTTTGAYCDAAAQFCAQHCYTEFLQAQKQFAPTGGDLQRVLTETLRSLDQRFLAEDAIPQQDRLASGCTAVLLHLALGPNQPASQFQRRSGDRSIIATAASLGPCAAVVGQRQGGFASTTSAPLVLCGGTAASDDALHAFLASFADEWQQQWPQYSRAADTKGSTSAKAGSKAKTKSGKNKSNAEGGTTAAGAPAPLPAQQVPTFAFAPQYCKDVAAPQALGFGAAKGLGLHGGSFGRAGTGTAVPCRYLEPRLGFSVQTAQMALGPADESVVLLSGGAAATISPGDAALLMHRMGKLSSIPFKAKPTALAEGSPGSGAVQLDSLGVAGPAPGAPPAADTGGSTEPYGMPPFNAARMLVRHAATGAGGRRQQASGLSGAPPAAVLALSLDWEPNAAGGAASVMATSGTSIAAVAAQAAAAAREGQRALYRWQLLRLYYKFPHKHRTVLVDRWHEIFDKVVGEATRGARAKEVMAWKRLGAAVQVSAGGAVRNLAASPAPNSARKTSAPGASHSPAASWRSQGGSPPKSNAGSRHTTPSRLTAAAAAAASVLMSPGSSQRLFRSAGGGSNNVSGRAGGSGVSNGSRSHPGGAPTPPPVGMDSRVEIVMAAEDVKPAKSRSQAGGLLKGSSFGIRQAAAAAPPASQGPVASTAAEIPEPAPAAAPPAVAAPPAAAMNTGAPAAKAASSRRLFAGPVATEPPATAAAATAAPSRGSSFKTDKVGAPQSGSGTENKPTASDATGASKGSTAGICDRTTPPKPLFNVQVNTSIPAPPLYHSPSPRSPASNIPRTSAGGPNRSSIPSLRSQPCTPGSIAQVAGAPAKTPTPATAPSQPPSSARNPLRLSTQPGGSGIPTPQAATSPVARQSKNGSGIPAAAGALASSSVARNSAASRLPRPSLSGNTTPLTTPQITPQATPAASPFTTKVATAALAPVVTAAADAAPGAAADAAATAAVIRTSSTNPTSGVARSLFPGGDGGVATGRPSILRPPMLSSIPDPADPVAPVRLKESCSVPDSAGDGFVTIASVTTDAVAGTATALAAVPSTGSAMEVDAAAVISAAGVAAAGADAAIADMGSMDLLSPDADQLAAWASQAAAAMAGGSPRKSEPQLEEGKYLEGRQTSQGQLKKVRKPWDEAPVTAGEDGVSVKSMAAETGAGTAAEEPSSKRMRMPLSPRDVDNNSPKRAVSAGGLLAAKVAAASMAAGTVSAGGVEVSPSMRASSVRTRR